MECSGDCCPKARIDLTVNGEEVLVNSFVTKVFANTVLGLVQSLSDVPTPETIELKISLPKEE